MARLTVKSVETIQGSAERREIPDNFMRGLYLVVQPSGSKSWAVRYRYGGRSRKHTIGSYPVFDLKAARDNAGKLLRAVSEGRDPEHRRSGSVEDVVAQFLDRHCKDYRPRSLKETERLLRLNVLASWHGRKLDAITRADVRSMLARIKAPVTANRVHSVTRKLFNWAVENDIIASSPVTCVRPPSQETSRDRVLTDDELRKIWRAAPEGPFGAILKLAILTGQRRSEVSGMEWAEIDGNTWTLSKERTKNGRQHEVPLSRQAMALLKQLPRISDRFVFSLNGAAPFNGFSKSKARFDSTIHIPDWTIHDLRRTAASGMAKLGVSLVVIEKVLNHISGSLAGIVGVYQRHEFAEEKRQALQQWADYVERLVR